MKRPKSPSTGTRYLSASAYNTYVSFLNPSSGQAVDGTPNAALTVATGIHASVSPWRSKEVDKTQTRVGISSYKIVIRYPQTYSVDSGMQIQVAGKNRLMEIDSMMDPDMQGVELHIFCFETDATS
jgi:SPP1 family predicted phage head-tail adaptor